MQAMQDNLTYSKGDNIRTRVPLFVPAKHAKPEKLLGLAQD